MVALASAKGSPGVTTFALGLAARWPAPDAVLVEADPAGGDLVTRFGLYHKPGLSTMALAARDATANLEPESWVQRLPCEVPAVLAAPGSAAAASLATLGERGARMLRLLAEHHPAVVVDAGRWHPDSPADPLLITADVVLLVVRPVPDEIRQADVRIGALRELASDVRLVLVGERGMWPPGEIAQALAAPVAQVVPFDRHGAGVLSGRLVPRRGWSRTGLTSWIRLPLPMACHSLARALAAPATPAPGRRPAATGVALPTVRPQPNGMVNR
jgi:MinD-like ATPase involved in chromosome partitioning or flagellar assembly